MRLFAAVRQRAVRLTRMVFAEASFRILSLLPQGLVDYRREVGDGMDSSTVTAPLFWIARTFPEAPPLLWRVDGSGTEEPEPGHPMLRTMQRPNSFYSGVLLWMATIIDWKTDGNAYWYVVRSRSGTPVELWWMPHWMIDPKGDDRTFIKHYEYRITSGTYELRPENVVHFRFGMDPEDPRRGLSPLKSVLREIFTDDEAARFTAALLRNAGVPGVVVSPDTDDPPTADDVKLTKAYIREMFSGERRGEPLVLQGKTKVEQFGFSPEQLILRELRRIPEERVSAVLGVPAIVAGLGAGLDRSTFTNYNEAREAAYEESIIPSQRLLAEDVRFQLLPLYGEDPFEFRFGFDLSKVRVLQEDQYRQALRLDLAVRGGWAMVKEARRPMGLDIDEARDSVFLRPANATQVDGQTGRMSPLASSRNGARNGKASEHGDPDGIAERVIEAIRREQLVNR